MTFADVTLVDGRKVSVEGCQTHGGVPTLPVLYSRGADFRLAHRPDGTWVALTVAEAKALDRQLFQAHKARRCLCNGVDCV